MPPEAREAFERGLELDREGSTDEALAALQRAVARAPDFVLAHRAYQNLLLARHLRGRLHVEYRALLDAEPASAARRYLFGRLHTDPRRQREWFEAALDADPALYFAHIGVGYASLELQDADRAERAFRRALELDDTRPEARHGLLRATAGRRGGATRERENLARDLLERHPGDALAFRVLVESMLSQDGADLAAQAALDFALAAPSGASTRLLADVLQDHGPPELLSRARAALAAVEPPATLEPQELEEWLLVRAFVEERSGDPRAALAVVAAAPPSLRRRERLAAVEDRLLLRSGRLDEWLERVAERRFGAGLETGDGGGAAARFAALAELARGGTDGLAGATARSVRLARGLLEHGFAEAAIVAAREALRARPTEAALHEVLDEALAHRRFVEELLAYFRALYRRTTPRSFAEVVDDLRGISQNCLGEDVVEPVVRRDYLPVGLFLDPDPRSGNGLSRYFDRYGLFFLLGQRTFSGVEGYLLRRIADHHPRIDGQEVYRVLGEDLLLPSRAEAAGGEIAGFAFESFIVLNADRARRSAELARALADEVLGAEQELLADPVPRARDEQERLAVDEPLSLAERAQLRAYLDFVAGGGRPEEFIGLVLDSIEVHERAHIQDARRFLPIWSRPGEKLALLLSLGFSPAGVEAWLEQRAQLVALAEARSPRTVLAASATLLGRREEFPPHSRGYADLARRLVRALAGAAPEFPEVDAERWLAPQLDRLGDEGLRRLARAVLELPAEPGSLSEGNRP